MTEATRRWTSAAGLRWMEVNGEVCVDGRDLGKWLLSINSREVPADKRERFVRYQREAALLEPAAQYRRAVEMLESFGARFPADLKTLKPTAVKK